MSTASRSSSSSRSASRSSASAAPTCRTACFTGGGRADILPFSHALAPEGRLELQGDRVLNMAGFEHAVPSAVNAVVEGGPALPVVPVPLYALLKMVAFSDRKAPKDLAGVFHCLQHYLEDDDRRYGAELDGRGVQFEYTGAYLLGIDGLPFLSAQASEGVRAVLNRFADPDSDIVGIVAHEQGRVAIGEEERIEVFEHFSWYRRGLGL